MVSRLFVVGFLLVAQGVMTEREVERVLSRQKQDGRPFGALAEEICGIDPSLIEAAWITYFAGRLPAPVIAAPPTGTGPCSSHSC